MCSIEVMHSQAATERNSRHRSDGSSRRVSLCLRQVLSAHCPGYEAGSLAIIPCARTAARLGHVGSRLLHTVFLGTSEVNSMPQCCACRGPVGPAVTVTLRTFHSTDTSSSLEHTFWRIDRQADPYLISSWAPSWVWSWLSFWSILMAYTDATYLQSLCLPVQFHWRGPCWLCVLNWRGQCLTAMATYLPRLMTPNAQDKMVPSICLGPCFNFGYQVM